MKKMFYFIFVIVLFVTISSCSKTYSCQCETINNLYNPDAGIQDAHTIYAKNKNEASINCEAISESWGSVVTTCKLQ